MIVRVASQHIQNRDTKLDQMVRVASMRYEAGLKEEMQTLFLKYIALHLKSIADRFLTNLLTIFLMK